MCNKHNVYGDSLSKNARITKIRIGPSKARWAATMAATCPSQGSFHDRNRKNTVSFCLAHRLLLILHKISIIQNENII